MSAERYRLADSQYISSHTSPLHTTEAGIKPRYGKFLYDDKEIDYFNLYLEEVRKTPLLSPEAELKLTNRLADGRTFEEGKTRDERAMHLTEDAKAAYDFLIISNLRLPISRVRDKFMGKGMEFRELVGAGNLGLMRGLSKFEPSLGFRVSTYVTEWIDKEIQHQIDWTSRLIRQPEHFINMMTQVRKYQNMIRRNERREATVEELAAIVERKPEEITEAFQKVREPFSLDKIINEDSKNPVEFGEMLGDTHPRIETIVESNEQEKVIQHAFRRLSDSKMRDVILYRYGFIDGNNYSLSEIARMMNISYESVRSAEKNALHEIKAHLNLFWFQESQSV